VTQDVGVEADGDLPQLAATPASCQLARLIGGDGQEPRPKSLGVTDRGELAPRDRPGTVGRFLGELDVAADHEADPRHVVVVRRDDAREGDLVPGGRPGDLRRIELALHDAHTL
jgi:hypothetical protein